MKPDAIYTQQLTSIRTLCKRYGVRTLSTFGSVGTERFRAESDVDLLVFFKEMSPVDYADAYFELAQALEELLNRAVDLVTEASLSNPYFTASVARSKRKLYR
ncbi:MAG: nucleotidyltransferase domain-containing protein [Catalinimonas sp.]